MFSIMDSAGYRDVFSCGVSSAPEALQWIQ
jgi:hypothetical protein